MTHLSSTGQNTVRHYYNTSTAKTHTSSSLWKPTQQGSLPFLDTLVTIEPDNTFSTTVYRKPTHTDQYLHWDSNHHITAKQSVFNTLAHRAKVVSSSQDKLDQELQHIKTALQQCQFPNWALNQWLHKFTNPNQPTNHNSTNNTNQQDNNPNKRNYHSTPYMPRIGEKVQETLQEQRNTSTLQRHQHP